MGCRADASRQRSPPSPSPSQIPSHRGGVIAVAPPKVGSPDRRASDRGREKSSARGAAVSPSSSPSSPLSHFSCRGGRLGDPTSPTPPAASLRGVWPCGGRPRSPAARIREAGTAGVRGSLADGQHRNDAKPIEVRPSPVPGFNPPFTGKGRYLVIRRREPLSRGSTCRQLRFASLPKGRRSPLRQTDR